MVFLSTRGISTSFKNIEIFLTHFNDRYELPVISRSSKVFLSLFEQLDSIPCDLYRLYRVYGL